ncbi:pentatricopeptide repeat-containing protein [Carex littledalei]|uniref:Pentatricopeptide repeat-containing protein n=1 Tax=Carex littledalei TaxID=544730 RepID=A0A833QZ24_9POAL|nr:pentatricopeptide repeat-containing protein [Carex littledalei]
MKLIPPQRFRMCSTLARSCFYRFIHLQSKNIVNPSVKKLNPHFSTDETDKYCELLDACIRSKSLEEGKKIHHFIVRNSKNAKNYAVLERVVLLYLACDEVGTAQHMFDEMPQRNVFLWNSMIRAYSWQGPFEMAIELYYKMVNSGVKPNKFTFPFVLKACSGLADLEIGLEVHEDAKLLGLESDLYVSTALIDMYMKCGCLEDAHLVFEKMCKRDIVVWNAMVAGYALHGLYNHTIGFILEMQREGTNPNPSTIVALLPVVGQEKAVLQGKSIHGFCIRRVFCSKDVLVGTALLNMYTKCDNFVYACRIFNRMAVKNEVTWSALIGGYLLCERISEALDLFTQMLIEDSFCLSHTTMASVLRACAKVADLDLGRQLHAFLVKSGLISDLTAANSLLSMYAKSTRIDDAMNLFGEMFVKDNVTYSALISGCVQNGNAQDALRVFKNMRLNNIKPDGMTMMGIIPACSHMAALQHGKCSHAYALVNGLGSDTVICNALIDMYAKCGRIDLSRKVFDKMPVRDVVSWNTMIAAYGTHGLGKDAISLFSPMTTEGFVCDDITFICLISACSHSGLVTEGKRLFNQMAQNYGITPRLEHYIAMVDLLGRGGFLNEAYNFITKMPLKPDVRVWGALLGACRIHKNIELGREVSARIQKLGHDGTGNFVLLSNIYSSAGRFYEAARVRIIQRDKGFKKSPGCSWIEIKGFLHAFTGGDRSHPSSADIYKELDRLMVEIRKLGYLADTSYALHDLEEEEKESTLLYHSEKLAIAFGILKLRNGEAIFITKNLRVCGDCHEAIKYISLVTKRSIVVRDVNRFHHFTDGRCSCGDFW